MNYHPRNQSIAWCSLFTLLASKGTHRHSYPGRHRLHTGIVVWVHWTRESELIHVTYTFASGAALLACPLAN